MALQLQITIIIWQKGLDMWRSRVYLITIRRGGNRYKMQGQQGLLPQLLPMYTPFSQIYLIYTEIICWHNIEYIVSADVRRIIHTRCVIQVGRIILDARTAHKCFPGPNIMCKRVSGGPERVGGDCWLGCPADYTHSTCYTARPNNIRCSDSA